MRKSEIDIFGEDSIAYVKKIGFMKYAVIREKDNQILATGFQFRKYIGDIIRTMYTGLYKATGDYVLKSDKNGIIYTFK